MPKVASQHASSKVQQGKAAKKQVQLPLAATIAPHQSIIPQGFIAAMPPPQLPAGFGSPASYSVPIQSLQNTGAASQPAPVGPGQQLQSMAMRQADFIKPIVHP